MLLHSLSFPTGGQCTLTFDRAQGWLRATWTGYINAEQALAGALNYLAQVGPFHCLYLLNDNGQLEGPWFESTRWLEAVWLPQAERLGLRYVAHVVQHDKQHDIMTRTYPRQHSVKALEVHLFADIAAAEQWLRQCQQPAGPPAAASPEGYRSLT